jgi:plasmid stabilization system protein ParE
MRRSAISLGFHCASQQMILMPHDGSSNGIRERCAHLARFPDMGRSRSDVHPGVRSLAHGSYVIYYRRGEDADEVHVLRIWHGRRLTPAIADLL